MTNVRRGANLGLATIPRRFKTNGIRKLIDRALWEQGIRLSPEKHHPFKMAAGIAVFHAPVSTIASYVLDHTVPVPSDILDDTVNLAQITFPTKEHLKP